jgi:hypothetical protein
MTKHDEAVEERKALVQGVLNWALDAADTNEDRDWITAAMNAFGELTASLSTARREEEQLLEDYERFLKRAQEGLARLTALLNERDASAPGEHVALIAEHRKAVIRWVQSTEPMKSADLYAAVAETERRLADALESKREFGTEPLGCPTPGACSCPPPIKEAP